MAQKVAHEGKENLTNLGEFTTPRDQIDGPVRQLTTAESTTNGPTTLPGLHGLMAEWKSFGEKKEHRNSMPRNPTFKKPMFPVKLRHNLCLSGLSPLWWSSQTYNRTHASDMPYRRMYLSTMYTKALAPGACFVRSSTGSFSSLIRAGVRPDAGSPVESDA